MSSTPSTCERGQTLEAIPEKSGVLKKTSHLYQVLERRCGSNVAATRAGPPDPDRQPARVVQCRDCMPRPPNKTKNALSRTTCACRPSASRGPFGGPWWAPQPQQEASPLPRVLLVPMPPPTSPPRARSVPQPPPRLKTSGRECVFPSKRVGFGGGGGGTERGGDAVAAVGLFRPRAELGVPLLFFLAKQGSMGNFAVNGAGRNTTTYSAVKLDTGREAQRGR